MSISAPLYSCARGEGRASAHGAGALKPDLLIVGGGLAGSLTALALRRRRPDVRVMLVDGAATLGGNHIWSFFDADVAEGHREVLAPLICHHWPGHEVRFPRGLRAFAGGYNSIESERLDAVVRDALPLDAIVTATAVAVEPDTVLLDDGRRIAAGAVIDARGARRLNGVVLGWQKFLGRVLRLDRPHGLTRPTIMDATVEQIDGYRFIYVLPFDTHRVFVEDTYYSDDPAIDPGLLRARIDRYAAARGWVVEQVEREEAAALPIAIGGRPEGLERGAPRIGMAAGLFQPMTGYSLPDAVRTAMLVADQPDLTAGPLGQALRAHAVKTWQARAFYRLLGRMLFHAAAPGVRWRVMARFYTLDAGLIARFYAGQSTLLDKLRILAGRPPVPLGRAMSVMRERSI